MAGSIEQRGPDTWRVRVSAGYDPVTGKRRIVRRTVTGTRQQAEEVRARLVVEVSDDKWIGTTTTVNELLAVWLPQARLEKTVRYDYGLVVRKFIAPTIGPGQLIKLRAHHLDLLYQHMADDGVGVDRIRKTHTVLRSALRQAVKWTWISRNPALDATPPPATKAKILAPTAGQVRTFMVAAEAHSIEAHVFFRLAQIIGARRGELCGLQWGDIDLDDGAITVRRSVAVISGEDVVKSTKTGDERDPAPLDQATIDLLWRWRVETSDKSLAVDGPDWVFRAPKRGGFKRPDTASRMFRRVADKAGLPPKITLHGFRHYVGTQLLAAFKDAGVASRRLGHSRTSTTTDMYGHATDGDAKAATDVLARLTEHEDA